MNRRWYYFSFALVLLGIPLHQSLLIVSGVLLLLVLGTIDIWAKYCFHNLHYHRQLSEQKVFFGEQVTFSLTIENAKLLPLPWLELEDTLPRALTIQGQHLHSSKRNDSVKLACLFSPGWYERVTRHYTVQCHARGVHIFGPTLLHSGDVFGFISREMRLDNQQYLLVYPLIVPITSFGLPARYPFGTQRAPRRLLEDPSRVIGVRDYVYGDSLRRVNWKATARTMQLQSKVYEATTTHCLVLFLNITSQMDRYYGVHPELQELSICATASVSNWAIDQGYAVGLYANMIMFLPDEKVSSVSTTEHQNTLAAAQLKRRRIHLPAASSEEQRKRIMEALARIQPYFGINVETIIQNERKNLPAGATVVLITSNISELLVDTLARLRRGGHSVAILFVGDTPPPVKLAGTMVYHLGGEATWQALVAANKKSEENTHVVGTGSSFHL